MATTTKKKNTTNAITKKKNTTNAINPLSVGNSVLIRSVTHYYTGKIVALDGDMVVLTDAAWIASTGRFSEALRSGVLDEVEPFHGPVAVGRGAIVDVSTWPHALPRSAR